MGLHQKALLMFMSYDHDQFWTILVFGTSILAGISTTLRQRCVQWSQVWRKNQDVFLAVLDSIFGGF
jgi:hypothetical protein